MKSTILINRNFTVGDVDKRLYSSFIEHLGRAVYGGIYEPDHYSADDMGFRKDVLELIKEIDVPVTRYPGGNFVSGYNWEDGIGDKAKRPKRLESAWNSIETNEIGIDEFTQWAKRAGTEIIMAVNLGTRGPQDAKNLLEYCNMDTDTYYSNLRKENGFEKPFSIKTWCLGNEMDGPWQIGAKTAEEYGRIAAETAKLMKTVDPSIELVACGSSFPGIKTFGDWELTVLEHTYDYIDYISMHQYFDNNLDNTENYLSKSLSMDRFIKDVVAICDAVKAKKHSNKTINISFDEWNVWFHSRKEKYEPWLTGAPQLEDIYTYEDALLVGTLLMTLQNNCDRVKIACLSQLVNVIAPIMTVKGGKVWTQTTFYPYLYASRYGRGTVMKTVNESDCYGGVPYLESSVVADKEKREITLFAVNRSLNEDMEIALTFEDFGKVTPINHLELYCEDMKATNSPTEQKVATTEVYVNKVTSEIQTIRIKKHSWNMVRFKY